MDATNWTYDHIAALQSALRLFPASLPKEERWQRIAQHVGKPTKECVARYKLIANEIQARSGGAPPAPVCASGAGDRGGAAGSSAGSSGGGVVSGAARGGGSGAIVGFVCHKPHAPSTPPAIPQSRDNLGSPRSSNNADVPVDPISLEPLADLPYPPFVLRANRARVSANDNFDGNVLASYLVSTGRFDHPISRRELVREECVRLDAYLVHHKLPIVSCYSY